MTNGTFRRLLAERYPAPWRARRWGAELWLGPTHVYRVYILPNARSRTFKYAVRDMRDKKRPGCPVIRNLGELPYELRTLIVLAILGRDRGMGEQAAQTFERMPSWLRVEMEKYAARSHGGEEQPRPGIAYFTLPEVTA